MENSRSEFRREVNFSALEHEGPKRPRTNKNTGMYREDKNEYLQKWRNGSETKGAH